MITVTKIIIVDGYEIKRTELEEKNYISKRFKNMYTTRVVWDIYKNGNFVTSECRLKDAKRDIVKLNGETK